MEFFLEVNTTLSIIVEQTLLYGGSLLVSCINYTIHAPGTNLNAGKCDGPSSSLQLIPCNPYLHMNATIDKVARYNISIFIIHQIATNYC